METFSANPKVSFLIEYFKPIRGFVVNTLMWPQGIVRHRPLVQGLVEFLHRRKPVLIGTLYSQGLIQALNDPVLVGFSRLDVFDFGLVARPLCH